MNSLLSFMEKVFGIFAPIIDLAARIYVAYFFVMSGYAKFADMSQTIALFQNQYHVPFLTPVHAAYASTAIELIFPTLLVLGFFTQLSAFVLFVFNIAAVYAYPFLLTDAGHAGLMQHVGYGMVLGLLMVHGIGFLSIDRLFRRYHNN